MSNKLALIRELLAKYLSDSQNESDRRLFFSLVIDEPLLVAQAIEEIKIPSDTVIPSLTPDEISLIEATIFAKSTIHANNYSKPPTIKGVGNADRHLLLAETSYVQLEDSTTQNVVLSSVDKELSKEGAIIKAKVVQRWLIRACVAAVSITVFFLWRNNKKSIINEIPTVASAKVVPGGTGAILTLGNGSEILIDSVAKGTVALQSNVKVNIVNGVLSYEGQAEIPLYNKVSTPRGRQFQLTLPDGTKVWLNSESSIRYPIVFKEEKRTVETSGEVYLEVAKDIQKPFWVFADNNVLVEVLGTRFNINAYNDDKKIRTTLLEGSVKLYYDSNGFGSEPKTNYQLSRIDGVRIKPGEMAIHSITDNSGTFRVTNVDPEIVLAWKNGYLNFDNSSIEDVAMKIERWYDIEIVLPKVAPRLKFNGKIDKNVNIEDIMFFLSTHGIKTELQGRVMTLK